MATATIERTGAPGQDQDRQHELERPATDVRGQQDQPAVEPVRDDPCRDRQDQVRGDASGPDESESERVVGLLVDHDQHRDQVEPVADGGDELADHQPRQAGVREDPAIGGQHRLTGT